MTNEIAKEQKCIVMRNSVELWVDAEKAAKFQADWEGQQIKGAVGFEGRTLNTADIVGVFKPEDMEAVTRRKNGEWQDKKGRWLQKGDKVCPGCGNIIPFGKTCGNCAGW